MDIFFWLAAVFGAMFFMAVTVVYIDTRFFAPARRLREAEFRRMAEEAYERHERRREEILQNEKLQEAVSNSAAEYDELMEAERIMDELNGIIAKPVRQKKPKAPRKRKPPKKLDRLAHAYEETMNAEEIMNELEREKCQTRK